MRIPDETNAEALALLKPSDELQLVHFDLGDRAAHALEIMRDRGRKFRRRIAGHDCPLRGKATRTSSFASARLSALSSARARASAIEQREPTASVMSRRRLLADSKRKLSIYCRFGAILDWNKIRTLNTPAEVARAGVSDVVSRTCFHLRICGGAAGYCAKCNRRGNHSSLRQARTGRGLARHQIRGECSCG